MLEAAAAAGGGGAEAGGEEDGGGGVVAAAAKAGTELMATELNLGVADMMAVFNLEGIAC